MALEAEVLNNNLKKNSKNHKILYSVHHMVTV